MSPSVFAAFVGFTVCAAALAVGAVTAGRRAPLGLVRLLLAAVSTAVLIALATVAGRLGRFHFGLFSVLQFVWLSAAFVAPAAGAAALLQGRAGRPVTMSARVAARLALLMVPVAVYAMVIEPRRLQLESAEVAARIPLAAPLRIGVLADLQCSRVTAHERAAVRRLMAQRPDVILLPGDVFQGTEAHFQRGRADLVALLRSLEAPGGVFVVRGDVDTVPTPSTYFDRLTAEAGLRVLADEAVQFEVRGQRVELYGFDRDGMDWGGLVQFLESPRAAGAARIVVSHWPDVAGLFAEGMDVDLFVAGHTHGGQVVVPFYGPPLTYSSLPRHVGAGGLHLVNGAPLYVSRGLGMERGHAPRVRFLCPPEVAVVTLTSG